MTQIVEFLEIGDDRFFAQGNSDRQIIENLGLRNEPIIID